MKIVALILTAHMLATLPWGKLPPGGWISPFCSRSGLATAYSNDNDVRMFVAPVDPHQPPFDKGSMGGCTIIERIR